MKNLGFLKWVRRRKTRGRPERDPKVLQELLRWEFQWQIIFATLRHGAPKWDTTLPAPETVGLKWSRRDKFRTESEKEFWEKRYRQHIRQTGEEYIQKVLLAEPRDIPPNPELWKVVSDPLSEPETVRVAWQRSQNYLRQFRGQKTLGLHAKDVCHAKRDPRYPRSNRKSSEDKRVEYLARVMAGLSLHKPISPATAVDLLRKMKHGKLCGCWRCRITHIRDERRS